MLVYRGSGVATYTHNLVKSLLKYHPEHEYRLFYSSLRRPTDFYYLEEFKKMGARVYDYPFPPRILKLWWNILHIIPVEFLIGKVDIFHSSDFLRPPLLKGTVGVTTIYDLTWKIFPEYHTDDVVNAHSLKIKKTIKYRDVVISISQNTKKDLLNLYPKIKKNRVEAIYGGVDDRFKIFKDKKSIKRVLNKYKVKYPSKFILYVGAIEPRKNVDRSVKVFSKLLKDKKYRDYVFLIVGRAGWKNENVFNLVKKMKLEKKVRFIGFVNDNDLPYFYNAASANMYLSSYEGFGLPPLEAAKCGCTTLLYNNSSLGEVLGKTYPYTKKGREVETLKKILNSKPSGIKNIADQFSWKKTSREYLDLFMRLNK